MVGIIDKIKDIVEEGEKELEEVVEKVEEKLGVKGKKKGKTVGKAGKSVVSEAEAESTTAEKILEEAKNKAISSSVEDLERKKKALLARAAKLKGKVEVDEVNLEELKEKVKGKKKSDMLVPLEEYVKAGIYLGTRVVTPEMRQFVYRRRADGLAIFNTDTIDEKLKEGIEFLSQFAPEDVVLVCKRQAGWKAVEKFSEITGVRVFAKKYPAGILTNKQLPTFFENELTIITDQWVDKNALNDTLRVRKKVLMICDTNNFAHGANKIIIGNNKSPKSLGLIFYLLAYGYCKARGLDASKIPDLEWWTGEIEERPARRVVKEAPAQFGV